MARRRATCRLRAASSGFVAPVVASSVGACASAAFAGGSCPSRRVGGDASAAALVRAPPSAASSALATALRLA